MRKGVALIVVLWLMAILTLLMYAFLGEMQVEYSLAGGFADEVRAEQLAWSAIDQACATLVNDTQTRQGPGDVWWDDETKFFEAALGDGAWTLVHPAYDDPQPMWGVEDEASKVNFNTASREILMKLPRMTEEIADSIIDWRDQDSNPGRSGAENSYYQGLNPPYTCKNQPFETIEELLYVRGMTSDILYGEDTNLNGRLDPNENDSDRNLPLDNGDGKLDPGLYAFVTAKSADRNRSAEDRARVNLNTATVQQLGQAGLTVPEVQGVATHRVTNGPFPTLAHLLNVNGITKARFKQVVDHLTLVDGDTIPGLININTAPKAVLLALPGVTEDLTVKIMEHRAQPGADLSTIGWLLDVTTAQELQRFANYVTARSYQFRIHAVGRIGTPWSSAAASERPEERPGAFKRMVAIFDKLATPRPRLVYWKDVTRLGMPYSPEDGPNP